MEEKNTLLIVEHLEQQSEKLDIIIKTINNRENFNSSNELKSTLKKFAQSMNKGFSNYHKLILETYTFHKTYFESLEKKMKPKIAHEIKFDRNSRNELLIAVIFSSLFIVLMCSIYRYTKDNTNYKKAWNYLMEKDLNVNDRAYYNEILKNSK